MKISLAPPEPDSPSFEVDYQIYLALCILGAAAIKIRGAGRFGNHEATILLEHKDEAGKALEILQKAGIAASAQPIHARSE